MRFAGWILLILVLMPAGAHGQVWVRVVEVPCVVTDSSGRFITDLNSSDFVVRDNGKVRKISQIKERIQAPLSIALLIDRSRSMADTFSMLRSASEEFLTSVLRKNTDRSCLVAFDSHVYLLQNWTDQIELLTGMIPKLTPSGGTSLFDAIYKTARDQFSTEKSDDRTKVIVVVTDGEDTTSQATFKQVADMVTQSGVMIYVLGVHAQDSLNPREFQGARILKELKDMTGGNIFYPKEAGGKIESLFAEVEHELRNEYILTFTTTEEPDGTFHKVNIQTTRKGLTVQTRKKGYLATG